MSSGWISLHRKFEQHPLWKEHRVFSKAEAWIDILWQVQHEDEKKVTLGMHIYTCYRGQSLKSMSTWARRWNWSRNKVWRYMKLLQSQNMIAMESEQQTTRITVCNYETYQQSQNADRTQIERKQNADRTQIDTDNNVNNVNNDNNKHKSTPQPPKGGCVFDYEKGQFQGIPPSRIQQWSEAYPAVDVELAIKQAALWAADNPAKRKKDWLRFLTNWMNRTQQRGGNKNELHGRTATANGQQHAKRPSFREQTSELGDSIEI